MRKRMFYLWGLGCLAVLGALACSFSACAGNESAPYKVVKSDGNIEIREYPDLVLASTETKFVAGASTAVLIPETRIPLKTNPQDALG